MNTHVQSIRCPRCYAEVREIVMHRGFQVGGSSIGPYLIPCPKCGLLVESGLSEWADKSIAERQWYIVRLILWAIAGAVIVGGVAAAIGSAILVQLELVRQAQISTCRIIIFWSVSAILVSQLFRNGRGEIRESKERTCAEQTRN